MQIEEHRWFSASLQQEMVCKVYGYWGAPVLVFPCSLGDYLEYETMGVIDGITDFILAGRIKLFCIDNIDTTSWYNFSLSPIDRNSRHEAYDQYVSTEVVPFIRKHCNQKDIDIITNGCSMGAFHALNAFLKHPELFSGSLVLSGLYRMDRTEFGLTEKDMPIVYYNSPIHYLSNLDDPWFLDQYRHSRITLCVGQGAWENDPLQDTQQMERIFKEKRIPAWVDYWGDDVDHDWHWWIRQLQYFLGELY